MNPQRQVLHNTDVKIYRDRIFSITKAGEKIPEGSVIDGKGAILLPGLINAHTHAAMSLFRNYGNDCDLKTWLSEYIWPVEEYLTAEDVYNGTRLNIAEMLLSGTTTFADMYVQMDQVARASNEMGIRAVLSRGISQNEYADRIRKQEALYTRWHDPKGRIQVMIGPHAIYTNNEESLKAMKVLGEKLDIGFQIHIAETRQEVCDCLEQYGKTPVEVFDDLGMLDERTLIAHGIWLTDTDIDIIKSRKSSIVHNPSSNMKLGSGILPYEKLKEAGINVALGTDGASSNNLQDMFREMFLASLIQKGVELDPKLAPAKEILEMATINGAKAIGRQKDLGSVEVGKKADLILVNRNAVHQTPIASDVYAQLVYATRGSDVCMTMVDGEVLAVDGKLVKQDEEEIMQKAKESWANLLERAKHEAGH